MLGASGAAESATPREISEWVNEELHHFRSGMQMLAAQQLCEQERLVEKLVGRFKGLGQVDREVDVVAVNPARTLLTSSMLTRHASQPDLRVLEENELPTFPCDEGAVASTPPRMRSKERMSKMSFDDMLSPRSSGQSSPFQFGTEVHDDWSTKPEVGGRRPEYSRSSIMAPQFSITADNKAVGSDTDNGNGGPILHISGMDRETKRHSLAERILTTLEDKELRRMIPVPDWSLERLTRLLQWMDSLQEPKRTGWLAVLVRSYAFGMVCVTVIALNALFIVYTTDREMTAVDDATMYRISLVETAFVVFYTVELLLKLWVHRLYFFWNNDQKWNTFDLMLVAFSWMDTTAFILTGASGSSVRVSFLRSFRLFKLAKVLRVFRALRFFTDLRLMLDCVFGSLLNLFWCLVMILFVLYVFSLLILQGISAATDDPNSNFSSADMDQINMYFRDFQTTLMTLLQASTGGCQWGDVYAVLVKIGVLVSMAFVFFILFFVIAAWNIITSRFVEKALKLAQPDLETLTLEQNMRDVADAEELTNVFNEADEEGTSCISYAGFQRIAEHPRFRSYLHVRGIDIKNVRLFYQMLSSMGREDKVDIRTMVNACLRMKGLATSIDLHAFSYETKLMGMKQQVFFKDITNRLQEMERLLEQALVGSEGSPSPSPRRRAAYFSRRTNSLLADTPQQPPAQQPLQLEQAQLAEPASRRQVPRLGLGHLGTPPPTHHQLKEDLSAALAAAVALAGGRVRTSAATDSARSAASTEPAADAAGGAVAVPTSLQTVLPGNAQHAKLHCAL